MRLIDADKLHYIKVMILHQTKEEATEKQDVVIFAKEIDKAPTVDAVPVVRCKDCKFYGRKRCIIHDTIMCNNDFCSYGKRKEIENEHL